MRIGIDCRTLLYPEQGERAGIGHYTTNLVQALVRQYPRSEFVLFIDHRLAQHPLLALLRKRNNVRVVIFPWSQYKKILPFGYSHVVVARTLAAARLDVFHAPAYGIPLQYRAPSVITVHDLAIYDHPEWFPRGQRFAKEVVVPASLGKARRIIAVSHATKKMIVNHFGTPAERIVVIYEGVHTPKQLRMTRTVENAFRQRFNLHDRFLLFVGTIEPRKNLEFLVRAFDNLIASTYPRFKDVQLVIAGAKGWSVVPIFHAISHAAWSSNIRVVGYVSEEEKQFLLRNATAFVFPSLWEGFGLPILEAMSVGTPVITSRSSALMEVGGDAVLTINPHQKKSLAVAIEQMLTRAALRKKYSERGIARAKEFTWEKCARETYLCYREVAEKFE